MSHIDGMHNNSQDTLEHNSPLTVEALLSQSSEVVCVSEQDTVVSTEMADKVRIYPETPENLDSMTEFLDQIETKPETQETKNEPQFVYSIVIKDNTLIEQDNGDKNVSIDWTPDTEYSVLIKGDKLTDVIELSVMNTSENVGTSGISNSQPDSHNVVPPIIKSNDIPLPQLPLEPTTYVCTHCGKICTVKSVLDKHVVQSHSTPTVTDPKKYAPRKFACPKCNCTFYYQGSLSWHMENNCQNAKRLPVKSYRNSQNNLIHQCTKCKKEFKELRNLHEHIEEVHNNNTPYECEICDKRFGCRRTLGIHKKMHMSAD